MSNSGSAGVFTTDLSLVVRSWDPWLAEVTGIPEADACGRPIAELFPELAERGHLARLERVATTGMVEVLAPAFHQYLIPLAPRTPSTHFARMQQHVSIAPLRAGDAMVGVAVTIEDVTARRERERQLAARLASADESERLQAIRALDAEGMSPEGTHAGGAQGGGGGEGTRAGGARAFAVAPLAGALGDSSWRVRRAAAEALGTLDEATAAEALLEAVRDRHHDPAVLNAAITALRLAGRGAVSAAQDVLPPLLALLGGPDADVRTYAALSLGLLEDPRAVPMLVTAMEQDADPNVRYHAIEALGRIGSRTAAAAVARVAESRDFAVAFAALDALALVGEPSVASRIVPMLDDDLLCPAAADALGRLGGEEVARPLAAALVRPGAPVASIALALARLHERIATGEGDEGFVVARTRHAVAAAPATVEALVAELRVASDEERGGIVTVLGWLEGDTIVPALARALEWPAVQRQAAELLARRGTVAVAPLLDALGAARASDEATDDTVLRKAAAAALGRIGAPAAVPALVALLDGPPDVAVVAAGALGAIGAPDAFEPLLARLDHPQAAVRQAVVAALCSLGHPALPGRLAALLQAGSPRLREAGVKIAGYFADPASLGPLLALAHDPDESVRRAAIEQLALFDDASQDTGVLGVLAGMFDAPSSPTERAAVARALAHVDATAAIPALRRAFADQDPWVRYYAARSAGHVRRAETVATLVELALGDPVPPVRIAAIEALGAIGDPAGLEALVPLASDPDCTIVRPALGALELLHGRETIDLLLDALHVTDRACRLAALEVLARRADAAPVPDVAAQVAAQARDDDDRVRAAAVDALARLARNGSEDAVAALIALAAMPRHTTAAVAALASLGEREAPWIARGLAHPDAGTRCAIIEALGRLRAAPAAISRLVAPALADEAEVVRLAAAEALGRLDLRAAEGDMRDHVSGAGR